MTKVKLEIDNMSELLSIVQNIERKAGELSEELHRLNEFKLKVSIKGDVQ